MKNEPVINNRNLFYRNNYKRLFGLLLVMTLANLILVVFVIYLVTHIPKAKSFASSPAGKNTSLYSLDQPLLSQKALLEWANQAAISIYTIDYLNYPKQLKENSTYFSPAGWRLFQNGFKTIVNSVTSKKLRLTAVANGPPVIIEQGPLLGHYAWKVRMPLLVTYESPSETRYQRLMIDMVIMQVSTLITPKGIAIAQFYATERPGQLQ